MATYVAVNLSVKAERSNAPFSCRYKDFLVCPNKALSMLNVPLKQPTMAKWEYIEINRD